MWLQLNACSRCGRYFATGSADALVSVWDANELACIKTFSRLEWPVRTDKIPSKKIWPINYR